MRAVAVLIKRLHFLDQALVSGLTFAFTVVLTRTLSIGQFGEFALIYSVIVIGTSIVFAGSIMPMLTLSERGIATPNVFYAVALGYNMFLSAVASVGVVIFIFVWMVLAGRKDGIGLGDCFLIFATFSCLSMQDMLRRYFFATHRPLGALLCDAVRYGLPIVLVYLNSRWDIVILDALTCLSILLISCFAAIVFVAPFVRLAVPPKDVVRRVLREFAASGWPLVSASTVSIVSDNLVFLSAGFLIDVASLGIWRSIQTATGVLNPLLLSLENKVPMEAAAAFRVAGISGLRRQIRRELIDAAFLYVPLLISMVLLGKIYLSLLFPRVVVENVDSYYLQLAIFSILFLRYMASVILRVTNQQTFILISSLVSLVLSGLFCFPAIHYLGLIGGFLVVFFSQLSSLFVVSTKAIVTLRLDASKLSSGGRRDFSSKT